MPDRSRMDQNLLSLAVRLAQEAAIVVLAIRSRGFKVTAKPDHSPVTEADIASQALILAGLRSATPGIPVIAEESPTRRISSACFWLVDPLDGTREFAAGLDEFVVNIGLVQNRRVVLGVVAVPALDQLFLGIVGQGAWKRIAGADIPIRVRDEPRDGAIVLTSRHDADDPRLIPMLAGHRVARSVKMGSALKFCRIAEGLADLYVRPGRTMEWDTAAPHAIVEAAGGAVLTMEGRPLGYGKPSWENPALICTGARTVALASQS